MSKKLYSIGEVSEIMGISVQTLRYYCNIGLIQPTLVDEHSGYRYFSYNQFHYIDRTRYLLRCGLSLKEIKEVLSTNDVALLVKILNGKKREKLEEIRSATETLSVLDWYRDYFIESGSAERDITYYVKHIEARRFVAIKNEGLYERSLFYVRFNAVRNTPQLKNLTYMRQFVSILDLGALLQGTTRELYTGMLVKDIPGVESENIINIPEGDFYCFKAPILSEGWNPIALYTLLKDKPLPRMAVSIELENNFAKYS